MAGDPDCARSSTWAYSPVIDPVEHHLAMLEYRLRRLLPRTRSALCDATANTFGNFNAKGCAGQRELPGHCRD